MASAALVSAGLLSFSDHSTFSNKVGPTRSIATGTGLSGGGNLSADRTISISAGGVGTTQLADTSVTTAKLADDSVTFTKLSGYNSSLNNVPGTTITNFGKIYSLPAKFISGATPDYTVPQVYNLTILCYLDDGNNNITQVLTKVYKIISFGGSRRDQLIYDSGVSTPSTFTAGIQNCGTLGCTSFTAYCDNNTSYPYPYQKSAVTTFIQEY
jgi:hypothetical protein